MEWNAITCLNLRLKNSNLMIEFFRSLFTHKNINFFRPKNLLIKVDENKFEKMLIKVNRRFELLDTYQ